MTDKEFLENLKVAEEIEKRGYHKVRCDRCGGAGYLEGCLGFGSIGCWKCHTNGRVWAKKEPSNGEPP